MYHNPVLLHDPMTLLPLPIQTEFTADVTFEDMDTLRNS